MTEKKRSSRRGFLATAAGALAVPYFVPGTALGKNGAVAPSERITIGVIGIHEGGMGGHNARVFMRHTDAQVVAVCNVDKEHLDGAAGLVDKNYGNHDCAKFTDFRELIARDDIDAVCVATPDHWHALCAIAAANAKKDIYCQKPITHTFAEGQALVAAVKKNDVIFQTGSQQRSDWRFRRAVEIVRNGLIGKVRHVEIGLPTGHRESPGDAKFQDPPAHVDYDFWCGPSEKLPYCTKRLHWDWRWHLSYGGGQLMDWIGHHNDIAHWSMHCDQTGPVEVQAVDFAYARDRSVWNSAWRYEVFCRYEDGTTTSLSNTYENGCRWIGDDGWVFVTRGQARASRREWFEESFKPGPVEVYRSGEHERNFLDCIKSRTPCICPAETGHRSITPGHLGMLSEALGGRRLRWDPKNEKVIGDDEADRLLKKVEYRAPWSLA
jgi:predicted dehydrogenase